MEETTGVALGVARGAIEDALGSFFPEEAGGVTPTVGASVFRVAMIPMATPIPRSVKMGTSTKTPGRRRPGATSVRANPSAELRIGSGLALTTARGMLPPLPDDLSACGGIPSATASASTDSPTVA